jgi:hypothetical protein
MLAPGLRVLLLVAAVSFCGCDDPVGLVRIHFSLSPPRVLELEHDHEPAPVDLLALAQAQGSVEVMVAEDHLSALVEGLPVPDDPELTYMLWLSPSEEGAAWVEASHLEPLPSGAASAHLGQADVPMDFATVRAAIVTLGPHHAEEPPHLIVLTGAVGRDEDPAVEESGTGGGGHEH